MWKNVYYIYGECTVADVPVSHTVVCYHIVPCCLVMEALGCLLLIADSASFWSGGKGAVFGSAAVWSYLWYSCSCHSCHSVGWTGCCLCWSLLWLPDWCSAYGWSWNRASMWFKWAVSSLRLRCRRILLHMFYFRGISKMLKIKLYASNRLPAINSKVITSISSTIFRDSYFLVFVNFSYIFVSA